MSEFVNCSIKIIQKCIYHMMPLFFSGYVLYKNRMSTQMFWHVHVMTLINTMSVMHFLTEIIFILKAKNPIVKGR